MVRTITVAVFILVLLSACGQEFNGPPEIDGYIVEKSLDGILVVNGISKEEAVKMDHGDVVERAGEVKAISFSVFNLFCMFRLNEGQYVRVWAKDGMAESFPAQAEIGKIEILKE